MTVDFGPSLLETAARLGTRVVDKREPVSRYVTLRGLKFHYLDWGNEDKPWMLCLHGVGQNAHMWDFTALAYCDRYHVIALDQRGHGDSEWSAEGDYHRETQIADVTAFIEAMGMQDILLVGFSMGGMNGIFHTARHPESIRTFILIDVGPESGSEGVQRITRFFQQDDVLDSFEAFVNQAREFNPRHEEWRIRQRLSHDLHQLSDGRWTWKYDRRWRDPAQRAKRSEMQPGKEMRWQAWESIACPILLIRGQKSRILSREVADRMVARNPHSQLTEVPLAGHRVPQDNPLGFQAALDAFLL